MRRLVKFMHGTKVLPIYGGQDIVKQIRSLKDGTIIIRGPRDVCGPYAPQDGKMDHVHTVVLDKRTRCLNGDYIGYGNHLKPASRREADPDVFSNHASGHCGYCQEVPG